MASLLHIVVHSYLKPNVRGQYSFFTLIYRLDSTEYVLSFDVASESEITPCNKIDKPLVVYRFTGNVMTSITTLRS